MSSQRPFECGHILGHFSDFSPSHDTFKETTNPARVIRSCPIDLIKNKTAATIRSHPATTKKLRNMKLKAKVSTMNLYHTGS